MSEHADVNFKLPISSTGQLMGVDIIRCRILKQLQQRGPAGYFAFARAVSRSINGVSLDALTRVIEAHRIVVNVGDVSLLYGEINNRNKHAVPSMQLIEFIKLCVSPQTLAEVDRIYMGLLGRKTRLSSLDILSKFDPAGHPDCKSGLRSHESVLTELLVTFDFGEFDVSLIAFRNYMEMLASCYPDANVFAVILNDCWGAHLAVEDDAVCAKDFSSVPHEIDALPSRHFDDFLDDGKSTSAESDITARQNSAESLSLDREFKANPLFRNPYKPLCLLRRELSSSGRTQVHMADVAKIWARFYPLERGLNEIEAALASRQGFVEITALMRFLWQRLPSLARENILRQALCKLDPENTGFISAQMLRRHYSKAFDVDAKVKVGGQCNILFYYPDGLTVDEFHDFYGDVGSEIEDDNFFVLHVWQEWNLNCCKLPKKRAVGC